MSVCAEIDREKVRLLTAFKPLDLRGQSLVLLLCLQKLLGALSFSILGLHGEAEVEHASVGQNTQSGHLAFVSSQTGDRHGRVCRHTWMYRSTSSSCGRDAAALNADWCDLAVAIAAVFLSRNPPRDHLFSVTWRRPS